MYFDNLTIAGLVSVGLYLLLPLLFGRELLRVDEGQPARGDRPVPAAAEPDCGAEPCRGV